ncbi:MAG: 50S ribosomal protein L34 [Planctomycetota bacterium]|nr:50S ribosomal protein L34 [Planctomycetota bacterium]
MGIPGRKLSKRKHRKRHGFRTRMKTHGGRAILKRRRRSKRRLPSAKH